MENKLRKFSEEVKKIELRKEEKVLIRNILLSHMRNSPAKESFNSCSFFSIIFKPVPVLLAIAVITSGIAYASENTVPNDFLYPAKIQFEKVREVLAISSEAKVQWANEKTDRRLQEAEKLALKGELDEETENELEEKFKLSADKANSLIAKYKGEGKTEIATGAANDLESILKIHGKVLSNLNQKGINAKSFSETINVAAQAANKVKIETETEMSSKPNTESQAAAEGKLKSAESKISEVRSFIEQSKYSNTNIASSAEKRARLAEEIIASGKTKFSENKFNEAFGLFQKAHQIAQEAKMILELNKALPVEIKIKDMENEDDDEQKEEKRDESESRRNSDNETSTKSSESAEKIEIEI